jgi:hypothetical protein
MDARVRLRRRDAEKVVEKVRISMGVVHPDPKSNTVLWIRLWIRERLRAQPHQRPTKAECLTELRAAPSVLDPTDRITDRRFNTCWTEAAHAECPRLLRGGVWGRPRRTSQHRARKAPEDAPTPSDGISASRSH